MRALLLVLLVCCSAFVLAQDADENPLPSLPRSFSVMVELNDLITNTTVYTSGYYDYVNERYRIEEHSQQNSVVTIVSFKEVCAIPITSISQAYYIILIIFTMVTIILIMLFTFAIVFLLIFLNPTLFIYIVG